MRIGTTDLLLVWIVRLLMRSATSTWGMKTTLVIVRLTNSILKINRSTWWSEFWIEDLLFHLQFDVVKSAAKNVVPKIQENNILSSKCYRFLFYMMWRNLKIKVKKLIPNTFGKLISWKVNWEHNEVIIIC